MKSVSGVLRAVGIAGVALVLLAAGSAWGQTGWSHTNINPPPDPELSHLEILELIYGGTWEDGLGPEGLDLANDAGITVTRVWDSDGEDELIHVYEGDASNVDQVWTDGTVTVTAEAKYADFFQSFGWNGGGLGTTYYELLTDGQIGESVTFDVTGDFLWGIQPLEGHDHWDDHYTWWSKQSYNETIWERDHMVTYFVEGLQGVDETVWLLFWEDFPCAGDEDFNDFVIEVRAIPEPATALLVAVGLVALGLRRRRAL